MAPLPPFQASCNKTTLGLCEVFFNQRQGHALLISSQVKPISCPKANAIEFLTHLAEQREPLVITQNGEVTAVNLKSTLTCPKCGHLKTETMPTDACQWFYECEQCHAVLKPKPGDCCVYCSYGSMPCPPIQERGNGGCCDSSAG